MTIVSTPETCSPNAKKTAYCHASPSSATSERSTVDPTAAELVSYLEAFPVRSTALPLLDETTLTTFGRRCGESWQMLLPGTSSPKTFRKSQSNMPQKTAGLWVTAQKPFPLERLTWVVTTFGKDTGYLHTPTTKADHAAIRVPDNSIDSVVTDPPYGLSFMGKRWDYEVPSIEVWAECLRVLKPGGHLLAFAGTRTQHRMACRIEDAGFELRDMIAWVYGSGFPKSMDVSKAIDKAAGAQREVLGVVDPRSTFDGRERTSAAINANWREAEGRADLRDLSKKQITAPATDAAAQWQGWGTALKPALETVTFASKPFTNEQERDIIRSNLIRLEARLWLLSSASAVEKSSSSSQSEYGAACAIAQWSADEVTNIRADLCGQMDTSLFELATTTSLNIVSSWRRTLVESWNDGNTSTTETKSSTTTDVRILKFSLSQITPASIIKACSLPGGFSVNASIAESHFNASLSLLQSTRTLSATERAMSQAQREHLGAGVTPNLDPCIMARKPLEGTVAANVLAYGTGALNIDGCRVGGVDGRWPANLIHDGSDEVLAAFPDAPVQLADASQNSEQRKTQNVYGAMRRGREGEASANSANGGVVGFSMRPGARRLDAGSAARFFYCAKASRKDRNDGCEHMERKPLHWSSGAANPGSFQSEGTDKSSQNNHPTVKPTDLMAYLCRLVTRPGGVVLDPFMGSGSTGKACMREGFEFIGIEREVPYLAIAEARIAHALECAEAVAEEAVASAGHARRRDCSRR